METDRVRTECSKCLTHKCSEHTMSYKSQSCAAFTFLKASLDLACVVRSPHPLNSPAGHVLEQPIMSLPEKSTNLSPLYITLFFSHTPHPISSVNCQDCAWELAKKLSKSEVWTPSPWTHSHPGNKPCKS